MANSRFSLKKLFGVLTLLALLLGILFFTLPLPGTIPVLMYHAIGGEEGPAIEGNRVTEKSLDWQMNFLKRFHYRVISLDDYDAIQRGEKKPRGREVVITFDDGDVSFAKSAMPILKKYQFPVAMFVISEFLNGGQNGSMTLDTVKQLQAENPWLNFQSHTKTHPHLLEIPDAQIKEEMEGSRKNLSVMLEKPITEIAYPYGQFNLKALEAAQEAGYRAAFTTGHKKLRGIPEGFFSRTRLKIKSDDDNYLTFWVYLSGIYQSFKSFREHLKHR